VRDIYEVLRKKQAEQAQLGKQIEALQTAAEQLRGVAHLLDDERDGAAEAANRG
jgi:cell division protein FtsB